MAKTSALSDSSGGVAAASGAQQHSRARAPAACAFCTAATVLPGAAVGGPAAVAETGKAPHPTSTRRSCVPAEDLKKTLCGLRSPCTMPLACMCAAPCRSCMPARTVRPVHSLSAGSQARRGARHREAQGRAAQVVQAAIRQRWKPYRHTGGHTAARACR